MVPVGFLIDRGHIDVETEACDVASAVGKYVNVMEIRNVMLCFEDMSD